MKKIIAGILTCILILSSSSFVIAENAASIFEIHNGVQFGMSLEEAIAYEKAAGSKISELPPGMFSCQGFIATGKVAGQENVDIYYAFSGANKLIQAVYYFDNKLFNSLESALTKKYGETDHSYITQKSYDDFDLRPKAIRSVFKKPMFSDLPWSQRIVKVSDSLTIAINHFDNTPSGDAIVYSALFSGDETEFSDSDLNDL